MDWSRIIDDIERKTDLSVSKEVGCRTQYISDLKSGKSKNPGADFVLKLINRFDLNPNWLLTGEGLMFSSDESKDVATKEQIANIPIIKNKIE